MHDDDRGPMQALALQIAAQLPVNVREAAAVLELAYSLIDFAANHHGPPAPEERASGLRLLTGGRS